MENNGRYLSVKKLTINELEDLMVTAAIEDRNSLFSDDILEGLELFIYNALQEADKVVMLLGVESKTFSDLIWQDFCENIKKGVNPSIGHRVRVNDGTLEIMYVENVYQGNGRYFADHITRSRKFEYIRKDFKSASQWEKDLVICFEAYYKINRKIFHHISEARRHLRIAMKEVDKKED